MAGAPRAVSSLRKLKPLLGLPPERNYNWVKANWLGKRESSLISRFNPVCNSGKGVSVPGTVGHFVDALRDEMNKPLDEFA